MKIYPIALCLIGLHLFSLPGCGSSTENTETKEPSSKNTETKGPSSKNTETKGPSSKNTETKEPSSKNTETKGPSSKNTETKGTSSEYKESSTQESRMVIELVISGMKTQSDADEVLDDLEGVSHVLEVKVDLKTGKAKILMDEDIEPSDAAKKIMALVDALPRGYSSKGYSFDSHEVGLLKKEWSWKRGW